MNRNPKALEGILEFCDQLRAITEDKAGRASGSNPALAGDRLRDLRGRTLEALPTFKGRGNAEEVTLFDGTGVGLQDLAVASRVVELAQEAGRAVVVDF